ncbi:MAG: YlxR family protein [Dehalococcoidia bacterium]|nr:YlxR family protein [Dehalococcoidia bacterium]
MAGPKGRRPRAIPERTCVACRESAGKRTLIRIVRTPEGRVEVDESGKAKGRGAYLHANRSCWEKGLKGGSMGYALRTSLAPEDLEALTGFGLGLPAEGID